MLTSWLVLIVMLIGLALYFVASNPKVQEVGRITFAAAVFALCFAVGRKVIELF
jgi:Na+/phosphate symporter